jgi:hypothetical protein
MKCKLAVPRTEFEHNVWKICGLLHREVHLRSYAQQA